MAWTLDDLDSLEVGVANSAIPGVGVRSTAVYLEVDFTSTPASAEILSIGRIGQAFEFDGVDDYVDLGSPASLNLDTSSNDVTVAAWIKLSIDPALRTTIFAADTDTQYWGATLGDGDSGDRQFTYYNDAAGETNNGIHANTVIPVGEPASTISSTPSNSSACPILPMTVVVEICPTSEP